LIDRSIALFIGLNVYSITLFILIVCLCMTTLTEVFPCFFPSCKTNARVKPAKTGHGPHLPNFVLFYVFLCCSMYCLFCVVLCIVCVYMCTVLLPPRGYPIAVKYISYHIISYHIVSYHIIFKQRSVNFMQTQSENE
jgi:hypothetical protein